MTARLTLRVATGADRGLARELNEDAVQAYVRPAQMGNALGLLIVADGMGGHQAGEIASQLAVDTIRQQLAWFLERDEADETLPSRVPGPGASEAADLLAPFRDRLQRAIEEANAMIHRYAQEHPAEAGNLGTTVTCALIRGDQAIIANVGDSRAYHLRAGELQLLTEDHSFVGQLVRDGRLPPDSIYDHPQRNVITRALGYLPTVEVDLTMQPLNLGDRLLLCSDGLWEMVRDPADLAQLLGQTNGLEEAVQELIAAANAQGGADNIAVAIAELAPAG
jgi:protein phosphatase